MLLCADLWRIRYSPEASLFITHSGLPPQVPGDVCDGREAEAPFAAALGWASEGSRPFHSGSEVGAGAPRSVCLLLRLNLNPSTRNPKLESAECFADSCRSLPLRSSTRTPPPPRTTCEHPQSMSGSNAFLDTTRSIPVESDQAVEPMAAAGRVLAQSLASAGLITSATAAQPLALNPKP